MEKIDMSLSHRTQIGEQFPEGFLARFFLNSRQHLLANNDRPCFIARACQADEAAPRTRKVED